MVVMVINSSLILTDYAVSAATKFYLVQSYTGKPPVKYLSADLLTSSNQTICSFKKN